MAYGMISGMASKALLKRKAAGGYIYLAAVGCPSFKIPVESADMAAAQMRGYVDHNGLGSSDLKRDCGNIYTDAGELVARVSYNGRVWDLAGGLLQDIDGGLSVAADGITEGRMIWLLAFLFPLAVYAAARAEWAAREHARVYRELDRLTRIVTHATLQHEREIRGLIGRAR